GCGSSLCMSIRPSMCEQRAPHLGLQARGVREGNPRQLVDGPTRDMCGALLHAGVVLVGAGRVVVAPVCEEQDEARGVVVGTVVVTGDDGLMRRQEDEDV